MRKVYGPRVRFLLQNGLRPIEVARAMGIPVARVHQIKYRDKVKALNNQPVEVKPMSLLDRIKWWIKK